MYIYITGTYTFIVVNSSIAIWKLLAHWLMNKFITLSLFLFHMNFLRINILKFAINILKY